MTAFLQDYMPVQQVDESAQATDMMGPDSVANQGGNGSLFGGSPLHSLIALWVLALLLYWGIGWFFKGERS